MGPIKMKKEYGWVKAKKKPIDGFPKKKERENFPIGTKLQA